MKARYLHDLPLKPYYLWTKKETKNWLHPMHGPQPHLVGLVKLGKDHYKVALWSIETCVLTMTEILGKLTENIEDRSYTPAEEQYLSTRKGWILSSLRWILVDSSFECDGVVVPVEADEEGWEWKIFREIMRQSVSIISSYPVGQPLRKD